MGIGILVGLALLIVFASTGTSIVLRLNFGLVALIANTAVLLAMDMVLNQIAAKRLIKNYANASCKKRN